MKQQRFDWINADSVLELTLLLNEIDAKTPIKTWQVYPNKKHYVAIFEYKPVRRRKWLK